MIRNFWIDVDIDGRKTRLSGGPKSKDGGFSMTICQRDKGQITKSFQIEGRIKGDELTIFISGKRIGVVTQR